MGYRQSLVKEESWESFEQALEEAVSNYTDSFAKHLAEDYSNYNVDVKGLDSTDEVIDVLGLDDYGIELSGETEDFRAYDIHLPEYDEPLLLDVERSVSESSIASDEERETVAYSLEPRSEEDLKLGNIISEFQKVTRPDAVEGNVSLFFRAGEDTILSQASSWEFFDEKGLMEKAVDKFEQTYPVKEDTELDFEVELFADPDRDWRIYEFDFEDLDEKQYLEITLRGNGFSMNWKQNENDLRYRNFIEHGFSEALEDLTD